MGKVRHAFRGPRTAANHQGSTRRRAGQPRGRAHHDDSAGRASPTCSTSRQRATKEPRALEVSAGSSRPRAVTHALIVSDIDKWPLALGYRESPCDRDCRTHPADHVSLVTENARLSWGLSTNGVSGGFMIRVLGGGHPVGEVMAKAFRLAPQHSPSVDRPLGLG